MPELPEVETIVRSLQNPKEWHFAEGQTLRERPGVAGRQVRDAVLTWERTLATPDVQEFSRRIAGKTIRSVGRRGKFVILMLDDDSLLFHLRMSGDLRVEEQSSVQLPHDRLWLNFKDGTKLVFNDTRKFGRAWLVKDQQQILGDLGPEPFDPALSGEDLYKSWVRSSRAIKTLLLDQALLAGVGNIYSDEALFRAGINPLTPGSELTHEKSQKLLEAIREVLKEGIERNGASIDWVYRGGDFQNHFRVYQRTGEACTVCGTPIERLVIGQRSSHFCPVCQI
jgi:formamidopyrimidine-DNA glycosylase